MQLSTLKRNSKILKSLGHAKRLEIVCLLHGHKLTVNQIVQMIALRQAAVSQHLMTLKRVGLVSQTKIGKEVYYSLAQEQFAVISLFIDNLTRVRPMEDKEPTVIDPICQMHLTPSSSSYASEYDGVRHYFCGKGCSKEFSILHKGTK